MIRPFFQSRARRSTRAVSAADSPIGGMAGRQGWPGIGARLRKTAGYSRGEARGRLASLVTTTAGLVPSGGQPNHGTDKVGAVDVIKPGDADHVRGMRQGGERRPLPRPVLSGRTRSGGAGALSPR